MVKTFTQSEQVLSYLQQQYGSADFSQWQVIRGAFYSFITYPEAGASELTFFGNALGSSGVTLHDTNLPKQGSFGQVHFLVKAIHTRLHIQDSLLNSFAIANSNRTTLASDLLAGFVQAGVLTFDIQSRNYLTLPQPFQYAAQGHGREQVDSSGIVLASGLDGAPGVSLAARDKDAGALWALTEAHLTLHGAAGAKAGRSARLSTQIFTQPQGQAWASV